MMKWIRKLFGKRAREIPRGPFPDRLFFYWKGGLDVDCEAVEIEYIDGTTVDRTNFEGVATRDFMKFNVTRIVMTQNETSSTIRDAFFSRKKVKVGAQFGGRGLVVKTEGFVVSLKYVGDENTSREVFSVLCPAVDF
jgi:predicted GNAT superfamily acetyltransferase